MANGTQTYTEATNTVVLVGGDDIGGTSGDPYTFAEFVTADRAGTATLLVATAGLSPTLALTYQIRPVEEMALLITFTVAGKTTQADYIFITGTDWRGAAQTEAIDVSAGNGAYVSTKYFRTITNIDCSDNAAGGGTAWADGTVAVTQPQWGVIWDYGEGQYSLDCKIVVGDGNITTWFGDTNKSVIIRDNIVGVAGGYNYIFNQTAQSNVIFGTQVSGYRTKDGVNFLSNEAGDVIVLFYAADGADRTLQLYSCSFDSPNVAGHVTRSWSWSTSSAKIYNCSINRMTLGTGFGSACEIYNTIHMDGIAYVFANAACSIDNVWAANPASRAFYFSGSSIFTVSNTTVLNTAILVRLESNFTGSGNLIDCTPLLWTLSWNGTPAGLVYRKNKVNIHVADKDGANLAGVAVVCEDADGNTTGGFASTDTDANGNITEQTIIRGYCNYNNANLDSDLTKDYSPHKFTLSAPGYETLILDNITVDSPIDWHLELQPAHGTWSKTWR